ncbi:MAG: hypothetical protein KGH54_01175 [Candidatus Micrarchaeota archaeon]|nr:hypothetical protein [Candidatus Micrarchaeota archaeon]
MQVLNKTNDNSYERFPSIIEAIRDLGGSREQKAKFADLVLNKIYFEQNHVYDSVRRGMGYDAFYGEENVNIFQNALLREFRNRNQLYERQENNPKVNVAKLSGMADIRSNSFDKEIVAIIKTSRRQVGL